MLGFEDKKMSEITAPGHLARLNASYIVALPATGHGISQVG